LPTRSTRLMPAELDADRCPGRRPPPDLALNRSYPSWCGKRRAPHRSVTWMAISPETVKLIVINLAVPRRKRATCCFSFPRRRRQPMDLWLTCGCAQHPSCNLHGCPCGHFGDVAHACSCSSSQIARYLARIDWHQEETEAGRHGIQSERGAGVSGLHPPSPSRRWSSALGRNGTASRTSAVVPALSHTRCWKVSP
jgi:hypothetical protein